MSKATNIGLFLVLVFTGCGHSVREQHAVDKEVEFEAEVQLCADSSQNGMTRVSQNPMWFMFDGVCAGPSSFVICYMGVEVKGEEDFEKHINRLLEFDWTGKPGLSMVFIW